MRLDPAFLHMGLAARPEVPAYLHIPKTGGSFEQTLLPYYANLSEPDRLGVQWHHSPLPLDSRADTSRIMAAALFRHPEDRLRSSYWWLRQMDSKCCNSAEFGYK